MGVTNMSAAVMERTKETSGSDNRKERRKETSGSEHRRDAVINVRLSTTSRDLIDRAAAVVGKTRSEFILESARKHAIDVLLDQRLFSLNTEQFEQFLRVLDQPPEPNAELEATAREQISMGEVTPYPGALEALLPPVPLTSAHDTSRFDCGKPPLNDWLRFRALKSEGRSARCYVLSSRGFIVGYYCISAGAIQHDGAPWGSGAKTCPTRFPRSLSRLALDKAYQGRGLGRALLKDALLRITKASELVGARAVLVHAVDQEVVSFYARYGFRSFPTNNQTLFLTVDEIVSAL